MKGFSGFGISPVKLEPSPFHKGKTEELDKTLETDQEEAENANMKAAQEGAGGKRMPGMESFHKGGAGKGGGGAMEWRRMAGLGGMGGGPAAAAAGSRPRGMRGRRRRRFW